jgi:pilus assembly protein CpaB
MKKIHPAIVFGFAALFGVLAVFVANRWLSSKMAAPEIIHKETVPLTKIVIAAQDIGVGTPLSEQNLTLAEWPKTNLPKGAFKDIKPMEGRVAVTKISAGMPLLDSELAAPGSGAGLVAVIPEGKRAMSIKVDEVIGVSGFVLPNTYVDVIGVKTYRKKKVADIILKKIKVLAIAQETHDEDGKAKVVRTVTLEVTPKESEKLALQTHEGAIHLVLRNPLEEEKPEPVAKAAAKPRRRIVKRRTYKPRPVPFNVEVIRGSDREKVSFASVNSEDRVK